MTSKAVLKWLLKRKKRKRMNPGIVSYGLYLPSRFETADEIAKKAGLKPEAMQALGIERKFLPSADDQPISMAAKAAKDAFEKAGGVAPQDIDVVIWTGEEHKDYIAQTASIRLQEEVGCRNAWAFDLIGQGVTSIVGLRIARDLMNGDNTVNTVLLAGGTRNVDLIDYANPDTHFLLAASASGGALILKRDYPQNHLMETAFCVDTEMADAVYVPGGGTEIPFSEDNLDSAIMYFQVRQPEKLAEYLKKRWASALCGIAKKVLPDKPPDYLALRHLSIQDRQRVLDELNVNSDQSLSLAEWGHHGPNDVIISLDLGLKSGAIRGGSLLVMVSGSIGFTYGGALIRWGKACQNQD
jgi:3-oxoacyl-[acyl-carrier-protein] synthase-3